MPDGTSATNLMTLGYDPDRKRYIGTWVGSMMTHLWLYEGELNPEQTALRLNSEGPAMAGDGTTAKYEDMVVFKSNDHRLLTARVQGPDGQWEHLMTVEYRRV